MLCSRPWLQLATCDCVCGWGVHRLCGYTPFFGETWDELFSRIAALQYTFGENWDVVSPQAKDFVRAMLQYDGQRPTSEQALAPPWLCGPVPATPLPAAQARLRLKEDPRAAASTSKAAHAPPVISAPVPACGPADPLHWDVGTEHPHQHRHHHRHGHEHARPDDDLQAMDTDDALEAPVDVSAAAAAAAAATQPENASEQPRPPRMLLHRLSDSFI